MCLNGAVEHEGWGVSLAAAASSDVFPSFRFAKTQPGKSCVVSAVGRSFISLISNVIRQAVINSYKLMFINDKFYLLFSMFSRRIHACHLGDGGIRGGIQYHGTLMSRRQHKGVAELWHGRRHNN